MSSVSQIALGAAVSVAMTGRRTAAWKAALRGADPITVYGTQPVLPFSYHPFGVGSVFIIDPLCKLPLLAGAGWALASRSSARSRFENAARRDAQHGLPRLGPRGAATPRAHRAGVARCPGRCPGCGSPAACLPQASEGGASPLDAAGAPRLASPQARRARDCSRASSMNSIAADFSPEPRRQTSPTSMVGISSRSRLTSTCSASSVHGR